jgi:hypothetical protein
MDRKGKMKEAMMICVAIAAAIIAGRAADAGDAPVPASIQVDVQMVSISFGDAAQLAPAFQERKTAAAAWARLQEMIAQGQAKLLAWPRVWMQSGGKSLSEGNLEYRYPTEFRPPDVATVFARGPIISPTWGANTPTAFENKNLGSTLEVEAKVEPGGEVISIDLKSQWARLASTREWLAQSSPLGIAGVIQQPDFQESKITARFRVRRGQPVLAGIFVVPEPEPHVELHILHARATLLPSPPPPALPIAQ